MKKIGYFLTGMVMLAGSCVSVEEWGPVYDDIVPGPVSNIRVKNVNGGAVIYYSLPSDLNKNDMMGAKVLYSLTDGGEVMERWASALNDSIELEGFGDTNERAVTIYAVHKNNKVSVGVPVTINPLTPLIMFMRESLQVLSTFGGVQMLWENPLSKPMAVELYVEDSVSHEMVLFDKYFSDAMNGKTTFRRFDPKKQNFHIEMHDRWQNYAPPMDTALTPLVEVLFASRVGSGTSGTPIWSLFDDGRVVPGNTSTPWRYTYRCDTHNNMEYASTLPRTFDCILEWSTSGNFWNTGSTLTLDMYIPGGEPKLLPFPFYVTMDMGKKAVYSRMSILSRPRNPTYSADIPVKFDVWGTNNPKTIEQVGDGSREANQAYWSSWPEVNGTDAWKKDWVKLGSFEYFLSSGENKYYSGIALSSEDTYAYQNGYEFEFNMDVSEPYRYLRWEIHETNTMSPGILTLCGLRYWGSYAD